MYFTDLATAVRSLVVEDDLGRRGDPGLGPSVVYLGESVVRVFRLGGFDDVSRAVDGLFRGASGYPTNAFVVSSASVSAENPPSELSPAQVRRLADGAEAVVVSVFDAETYLLAHLSAPELS